MRLIPTISLCAVLTVPSALFAQQEQKQAGSEAKLVRSARSGVWSAATTWEGGKVPGPGARVQVRTEDRVTYDLADAKPIRSIHVAGTLTFATDRDTLLEVGLIKIQAGTDASENGFDCDAHLPSAEPGAPLPTLEVGTPCRPIDAKHTARIRLLYFDGMDKESCPAIVCCGGRMEFHGATMNRTWVKLGADVAAGDKVLKLKESVTGWRVGDRLIVTATARDRGLSHALRPNPAAPATEDPPLTEERIIRALDDTTVTLDQPLAHPHLGSGSYRGEVANLSRNVVVESADPAGIRGHTMYHRGSTGSISYAEFRHLGKKDVLGRYSIHYHLVGDTMRGSSVIGASIWDSDNRWLTIHGTNYLVVRDCVGYKSVGHGFYLEDGTETYNVLDRNLAVGAAPGKPLPKQALPFDRNEGAGFWWANCLNTFTDNVACDCDRYGFRFEASPADGFDLQLRVRQPEGTTKKVDIRTLPFIRFVDNEAHAVTYGLNLGEEGSDQPTRSDQHSGVGPDERHPFVVRNTKIWNARWGIRPETPCLLVDGLDLFACVYGVYRGKFNRHAYDRLTMTEVGNPEAFSQGFRTTGLEFPNSGKKAFDRIGAEFSEQEKAKFSKLIATSSLRLAPADAERLVRGSYNTDGKIDGKELPRIYEDPSIAKGTGVTFGPLSSSEYPKPLAAVDDLPPATVITSVERLKSGKVVVRGTTSDNGTVKCVRVNNREALQLAKNFAQWEIVLDPIPGDKLKVVAAAEDNAGNVEKTAHELVVNLEP
jgi:hypothetical protein